MTTFGDGVYQFGGVPVASASGAQVFGNAWFVDNVVGLDGNSGEKPGDPVQTIARAVALCGAGDTIYINATGTDYSENVTLATNRVTLMGCASAPREVNWTVGTANTTCLVITGKGCRVSSLGFRPNGATTGYAIDLQDDAAGTKAYNTVIDNCYFRSTGTTCKSHILANGQPENCRIINNHFTHANYAINNDTADNKPAYGWWINGNHFSSKLTTGLRISASRCRIMYNTFAGPGGLDTVGYSAAVGNLGNNQIFMNSFGGDFGISTGKFKFNATDNMTGNYAFDVAATSEVNATTGEVKAIPA
jgi:hypothetical protein